MYVSNSLPGQGATRPCGAPLSPGASFISLTFVECSGRGHCIAAMPADDQREHVPSVLMTDSTDSVSRLLVNGEAAVLTRELRFDRWSYGW